MKQNLNTVLIKSRRIKTRLKNKERTFTEKIPYLFQLPVTTNIYFYDDLVYTTPEGDAPGGLEATHSHRDCL